MIGCPGIFLASPVCIHEKKNEFPLGSEQNDPHEGCQAHEVSVCHSLKTPPTCLNQCQAKVRSEPAILQAGQEIPLPDIQWFRFSEMIPQLQCTIFVPEGLGGSLGLCQTQSQRARDGFCMRMTEACIFFSRVKVVFLGLPFDTFCG